MRRALPGLAIACSAVLAGCDDGAPAAVRSFRFTAPGPAVEVLPVPGEQLALAWQADVDGDVRATLALRPVTPSGPALALGEAAVADGGATWTVPDPPPRGGLYQLAASLRAGDDELAAITAPAIVIVQGVEFRDRALAFTGADPERDLWITAATASVLEVELYLAERADGPRAVLARSTVASDLAPIGRVFRFTGTTVDGAPIPAGEHLAFLEARGRATYVRGGLTLTWTP